MRRAFIVFGLVLGLFASGCATQKRLNTLEGHGAKRIYTAPFESVWRAAIDAAQLGDLEVLRADRANGYIASKRGVRVHTFGENVGIWVRSISPTETSVEIASRQAGPPKMYLKNWEDEIHRAIAANLTREAPMVGASPTVGGVTTGSTTANSLLEKEYDRVGAERRVLELRQAEQVKQDELLRTESARKRAEVRAEIDRLSAELKRLESQLQTLDAQDKRLRIEIDR